METREPEDQITPAASKLGLESDADMEKEGSCRSHELELPLPVACSQEMAARSEFAESRENPRNWSKAKKTYHALIPATCAFTM